MGANVRVSRVLGREGLGPNVHQVGQGALTVVESKHSGRPTTGNDKKASLRTHNLVMLVKGLKMPSGSRRLDANIRSLFNAPLCTS